MHSFYLPHPTSSKIIIYFHGNGGNIYGYVRTASQLRDCGAAVLLVDYRGYGKSKGKPSEIGVYRDGRATLRYAVEELKYKHGDVIIFGFSLGTAIACQIAQGLSLGGMVLVAPMTSGKEYMRDNGNIF
ncbi:MAG: alpha/beta fold hydrolase, partial [Mycoplasmataceae bacterium]|nr:alpha/beta fold hydrolase [Mycoplasmataceae bacterium]